MRVIQWYPLEMTLSEGVPSREQVISMPKSAKLLSVGLQQFPSVWAMVDPAETETKSVTIYAVAAGVDLWFPFASVDFLGTVITARGHLAWHIFYKEG